MSQSRFILRGYEGIEVDSSVLQCGDQLALALPFDLQHASLRCAAAPVPVAHRYGASFGAPTRGLLIEAVALAYSTLRRWDDSVGTPATQHTGRLSRVLWQSKTAFVDASEYSTHIVIVYILTRARAHALHHAARPRSAPSPPRPKVMPQGRTCCVGFHSIGLWGCRPKVKVYTVQLSAVRRAFKSRLRGGCGFATRSKSYNTQLQHSVRSQLTQDLTRYSVQ